MMIGMSALGRQKSNKNFKDLNSKFDFGLLKEGRFLGPGINRAVCFLDSEYFFEKTRFETHARLYSEKSILASRRISFGPFLSIYC